MAVVVVSLFVLLQVLRPFESLLAVLYEVKGKSVSHVMLINKRIKMSVDIKYASIPGTGVVWRRHGHAGEK